MLVETYGEHADEGHGAMQTLLRSETSAAFVLNVLETFVEDENEKNARERDDPTSRGQPGV